MLQSANYPKMIIDKESHLDAKPRLHGLVELDNEQYHSGPGISKSKLDAIAVSGLNYWDKYVNPDREPEDFKHCFAVGDGTHKLILEPGTFEQSYAVGFDKSAYPEALDSSADLKKACSDNGCMVSGTKPELAERLIMEAGFSRDKIMLLLEQDHNKTMAGKIAMPSRDYKNMIGMLRAVQRDPWAGGLLSGATSEQSFFIQNDQDYIDHETGEVVTVNNLRKCRTDSITANGEWIVDLKTTEDVSLDGFGKVIVNRRYEVQSAWYLDILKDLYGKDAPRGFAFIAAQKTRPYDVAVHYLTDEQIQRGRRLYQRDVLRLNRCMETNTWPGAAGGDLLQAQFPRWAEI